MAVSRESASELGLQLLQPASVCWRSVRSRMKPVKKRCSPERISPTASSIGKVEPSLRSPTTTRPMPMMRRSPVVR